MVSISQNIKIDRYIRKLKKIEEYIFRWLISNPYKVYFPYKVDLIHTLFKDLKENPPIKYCNKNNAKILHLVMGGNEKDLTKNHVIEIIDHAFSIIASYEDFPREPVEYYNRQSKIEKLYLNNRLKKIIFISNGQRELMRHYFPQKEILDKSVVIPICWKDNIDIGKKKITKPINFLFIASNYKTKGVDVALKAWEKFKSLDTTNATLTLVSHDIPKEVEGNLHKTISLYKNIPMSEHLKNELYKNSDVALALALTDSIISVEITSFGKPIITYRTQHSKDFINNDNGVEIDVPINMYDVDKYGILWKTKKEFDDIVKEYISNGAFEDTIDELVKVFSRYCQDREFLDRQTNNSIEKYYKDYTIENRNKKLLEVYNECR